MADYIGRCYVEITLECVDSFIKKAPKKIYFKNFKTAQRFAYYWTRHNGYFVRIFEYHLPGPLNDFQLGYDWVMSVQYGKDVASAIYTWQYRNDYMDKTKFDLKERTKDILSCMYGVMGDQHG